MKPCSVLIGVAFVAATAGFFGGACVIDDSIELESDVVPAPDPTPAPAEQSPANPMILVPGFPGFQSVGPVDYFFGVAEALAHDGETVYVAKLGINGSRQRGQELALFIDELLADTGADRVVLIGHSQAGQCTRAAAAMRPDKVAAVVSIASPHYGTPLADVFMGIAPGMTAALGDFVFGLLGQAFDGDLDAHPDVAAAMVDMTSDGAEAFNDEYPQGDGIAYYSIAGRSWLALAVDECRTEGRPYFISKWDDVRDVLDPTLAAPGALMATSGANDGMISVSSSKWGRFLGCVPADHLDQVGQLIGDPITSGSEWNHKGFFVDLVEFLRDQGH